MLKRHTALFAAFAALLTLCACTRAPAPRPDASSSPDPEPTSAVTETDPPPSSPPADAPGTPEPAISDAPDPFFAGMLSQQGPGFSFEPAEGFLLSVDLPPFRFTRGDAFVEVGYDPSALPDELAPSFMNGYLAFTDIEFSSYSGLGPEGLSAETVTAGDGSRLLTAYLIEADGGCVWLLFSCPADDAETLRDLDAMRGSFILEK